MPQTAMSNANDMTICWKALAVVLMIETFLDNMHFLDVSQKCLVVSEGNLWNFHIAYM
jgi:hypothetical protein